MFLSFSPLLSHSLLKDVLGFAEDEVSDDEEETDDAEEVLDEDEQDAREEKKMPKKRINE